MSADADSADRIPTGQGGAWRHGWGLARAYPGLFTVTVLGYIGFYSLPLANGLIIRAVFDRLSGHAPAGLSV